MTQASVIANQQTKTSLMAKIRELDTEVGELQAEVARLKEALRIQNQELEHYGKTKKQLDRAMMVVSVTTADGWCPPKTVDGCPDSFTPCERCIEQYIMECE